MQKANLYEAILLVNRGIDETVRGLERLKRLKGSRLNPEYLDERLVLFEEQRARLNGYFCNNIENGEDHDADLFEQRYREYREENLDEIQVYRDVAVVEQRRRVEGSAPKVRFLTDEEQGEWERQYPKAFRDAEDEARGDTARRP
jgi:hypothetical protein